MLGIGSRLVIQYCPILCGFGWGRVLTVDLEGEGTQHSFEYDAEFPQSYNSMFSRSRPRWNCSGRALRVRQSNETLLGGGD